MCIAGSTAVRADPSGSGDLELWELHEELLREVRIQARALQLQRALSFVLVHVRKPCLHRFLLSVRVHSISFNMGVPLFSADRGAQAAPSQAPGPAEQHTGSWPTGRERKSISSGESYSRLIPLAAWGQ